MQTLARVRHCKKMGDLLLVLLLLATVLPRAVGTQGSCPGAAEFEAHCSSARRASVGNCLVCVASHPQFSSCASSSLADAFCSGVSLPLLPAQQCATIFVDAQHGSDAHDGCDRASALQTLAAAQVGERSTSLR